MESHVFDLIDLDLPGGTERVLRGGRHLFPLLPQAFHGVERIGVIGWGPQGRAQAMNLRDSLHGSGITVGVGLRRTSPSWAEAEAEGFSEADGTLGEVLDVIEASDLNLLLIADAALADRHEELFSAARPGTTIGLSHGFLLAHLRQQGLVPQSHVSLIAACPKGMGASVRRLYEQGAEVDGAGINASVAVERDLDGWGWDRALAWAVGIGSPYVFETTLMSECLSDIVGERASLLGGLHGVVEALYRRFRDLGDSEERAFLRSTECVTGPLARAVSQRGLHGAYDGFEGDAKRTFEDAYCAAYPALAAVIAEAYDEVASGNELRSVQLAGRRLAQHPMAPVDGTRMWAVGERVRAGRDGRPAATDEIDPTAAGFVTALFTAQIDVFAERGHRWSEIANESVIESVDSLIPFMHARGVAYMIDNCSTTARLGARKWGPRFEAAITQQAIPLLDADGARDDALLKALDASPAHDALHAIAAYRPSVDIAVD
jgi:ketol-acid reductoisomerase